MDPLNNPAFLLFAFFSPVLIAVLKQAGFSRQVNAMIAQIAYVVIGVAAVLLSGEPLTLENAVQLSAIATVVGSAAYGLIWNNLGAGDDSQPGFDDRLTAATSIIK